jgi:hypothetical protein
MAKAPITFESITKIGLTLPGAALGTAYGSPALKANGRMFAVIATNKSSEPNSLCLCVDFDTRDELIAADPDVYYTADHYLAYPCVLVRLSRVHRDALKDLLVMGCRFALSRGARKRAPRANREPKRVAPQRNAGTRKPRAG